MPDVLTSSSDPTRDDSHSRQSEPIAAITHLRFAGGETLTINLPIGTVQDLLQQGLQKEVFINLTRDDGHELVINPLQVEYLQSPIAQR